MAVRPADFPPPFDPAELLVAPSDPEDERIEVGVVVVGGGPAGLACANRLLQLAAEDDHSPIFPLWQELVLGAQSRKHRDPKLLRSGRFAEGLISADPSTHGISLWTRVTGADGGGKVLLEVAREDDFKKVVARKLVTTNGSVNHAVKARLSGLKPHTEYFYRFANAKHETKVGHFRTAAPADSHERVRFAYWSCQDYTHGYFNAHEAMAREDLDFMICLGDYIYAETYHTRADGTGVRDDTIGTASEVPPASGNAANTSGASVSMSAVPSWRTDCWSTTCPSSVVKESESPSR